MNSLKDLLFDTGFKKDYLKTKYKILWMLLLSATMLAFFIAFGYHGVLWVGLVGGISYYSSKWLFFPIIKITKKEKYIYYPNAEIER